MTVSQQPHHVLQAVPYILYPEEYKDTWGTQRLKTTKSQRLVGSILISGNGHTNYSLLQHWDYSLSLAQQIV